MSLKILMIPFSILMILVLGIGFIKPDYTTMGEKKVLYASKLAEQDNIRMLIGNIDTLNHAVDTEKEAEDFLQYYIPKDTDQDRVIDMLNFLAAQSGVLTDVILITPVEEDPEVLAAEQAALAPDPTVVDPITGAPLIVLPPYVVKTRSFSANITVKGKYENIKEFLGRVAHMNRLHKTREFSISTGESNSDAGASDILIGKFRADFDYLVPRPVESAANVPIFSRGSFNLGSLKMLSEWVTNRVPLLEKPDTGRTNPFQQ